MKNVNHIIALISTIRDKANKLIISELKQKSIVGLVPSHGNILYLLYYAKDNVTMQDIAKKINRDKSTVTSLVNKLVKLGYIEKLKNSEDSRSTIISLTEKGWELKVIFDDISDKLIETVYKDFSQNEKIVVIEALEKINRNI